MSERPPRGSAWEIGWVGMSVEDAPAPFGNDDYPAEDGWEPFAVTQTDQGAGLQVATIWFRRLLVPRSGSSEGSS